MAKSRGSRISTYYFAGKQRFIIIAVLIVGLVIAATAIAAFSGLQAELKSNNSVDTDQELHVDATPAPGYSLSIEGKSADGQAVSMWMTIKKGNEVIKSGLTPLTLPVNPSGLYSIVASDYSKGNRYFDHWSDGTTSKSKEIVLNEDAHLVAYYRTKASTTSITPKTTNEGGTTTNAGTSPSPPLPSSISPASITSLIPKTGVIVPLYMYPGSSGSVYWQKVIDEKHKHPSVPIVAVFNPSTGPGKDKDGNIANWVTKLKDSGVIVLGYTYDKYGERSTAVLKSDVDKYHEWYAADGIFIDEFANYAGSESHYSDVTHYAKSLGMKLTLGNPGADIPKSYIGTVDVINISEGKGYVPISQLQYCSNCSTDKGWHYLYAKQNFSYTRYDASSLDTGFIINSSKWVGLVYISDGNDSNARWFHLPPYFGTLVATLDR